MENIKTINIYVGKVGSTFINKDTAEAELKKINKAVTDLRTLQSKIMAAKLSLTTALTNATKAQTGAQNIINAINTAIEDPTNALKVDLLGKLLTDVITEDTDEDIYHGGNIETAANNIATLNAQNPELTDIQNEINSLLTSLLSLQSTKSGEVNQLVNDFNEYIKDTDENSSNSTMFDDPDELTKRVNKFVKDNTDIINDANTITINIEDTTEEISNRLTELLESDEVDPEPETFYWYAGPTAVDITNFNTIGSDVESIPESITLNDEYLYIVCDSSKKVTVKDENNFEIVLLAYKNVIDDENTDIQDPDPASYGFVSFNYTENLPQEFEGKYIYKSASEDPLAGTVIITLAD